MENKIVDPFNDEYLVYDYTKHEYKGTPQLLKDFAGIDLSQELDGFGDSNESTLPQRFMDKVSRLVYQYLYNHAGTTKRQMMQYILAKNLDIRDFLKDWISEQGQYMMANGYLGLESGIDYGKLKYIDMNQIRGSRSYAPLMIDSMRSLGLLNTNYTYTLVNLEYKENNY